MVQNSKLKICEIFPSIQGEGLYTGKPAIFIRLYGCENECEICDTKYSWQGNNYTEMSISEITDYILTLPKIPYIVITGGEPLLQYNNLTLLLKEFANTLPWHITEIETSGYYYPLNYLYKTHYAVSPKLSSCKCKLKEMKLLYYDNDSSFYKFVVKKEEDLKEVEKIITDYSINPSKVYIMAKSNNKKELVKLERWLFDYLPLNYPQWTLSTRLHLHLYNGAKGK